MKFSLLMLISILTGCVSLSDNSFKAVKPEKRLTNKTTVMWITVDDVDATCKSLNTSFTKDMNILGCAEMDRNWCKIYTNKNTTMTVLGHELRHCFEGYWHE